MFGRVVLIEREALVREALTVLLQAWGAEVVSGANASEALTRTTDTVAPRFAVVSAPGGDAAIGITWIAWLRYRYRDLPTVLIADESGDADSLPYCEQIPWPASSASLRNAVEAVANTNITAIR